MTRSTWTLQLLCALGMVIGPGLNSSRAKDDKETPKGKGDSHVIILHLDASKLPPDVLKQLMSLSQTPGKGGDKKPEPKKGEENPKGKIVEKNPPVKPDFKKGEPKKGNIIQVDLDQLSPGLAKQLMAELAQIKGGKKGEEKKGEEKKGGDSKEEPKGGKKKGDNDNKNNNDNDNDKKSDKKKGE